MERNEPDTKMERSAWSIDSSAIAATSTMAGADNSLPATDVREKGPNTINLTKKSKRKSILAAVHLDSVSPRLRQAFSRQRALDSYAVINDDDKSGQKETKQDRKKASESINTAISLVEACKSELSLESLDTSIFLFRQVLDRRSAKHALYTDAMRDLASSLGVRFMHTLQMGDWHESTTLSSNVATIVANGIRGTADSKKSDNRKSDNNEETESTAQLAKEMLLNFNKSSSVDSINKTITLLQDSFAIVQPSTTHPLELKRATTLADALHLRYCKLGDTSDLDSAMAGLKFTMKMCADAAPIKDLYLALCRLSIIRETYFVATGQQIDPQEFITLSRQIGERYNRAMGDEDI